MKNKVAAWSFVLVSCINPSLETGLDTLRDEIEKLQSQVQVVDVSGLVESVTELESTVDTLVIEFDNSEITIVKTLHKDGEFELKDLRILQYFLQIHCNHKYYNRFM